MVEFEVFERDLLARIGRIKTKSGVIETPSFLPVINPVRESVEPKELWENFNCKALITNAYIVKKHFGDDAKLKGIHEILKYPGVIMTDSGAYQILVYGSLEITNDEIIRYQEEINTDIATILDLPTGWDVSVDYAKYTVEETLRRAREWADIRSRTDIVWVGPIQGGRYIDLIAESARDMGKLPFDIHALGSPTRVMEQYLFDVLVDMIVTAKMNSPIERPFHLFGAGHPIMFSLAVALGCDLFDSAAYSIFAREGRYLTDHGTIRIEDIEYLPCSCPVCVKYSPRDLMDMPSKDRERELSRHNLYVCFTEIRRIKQAIVEGRLWEYLEARAHTHPSLLKALKRLKKYCEYIERGSPYSKKKGLFFFGSIDLIRPEVIRHYRRLKERYAPPKWAKTLVLIPDSETKMNRRRKYVKRVVSRVCRRLGLYPGEIHVCFYSPPFGVIPIELAETYPLYQYEYAYPPDHETIEAIAEWVSEYIAANSYMRVIFLADRGGWSEEAANLCVRKIREREVKVDILVFLD
ncbi:MAG: tRNA guanosine(15) transglycosylase TgtA [Candidatus Bathyarchaeia archaeon]|nr:tRNA guanosine(15) transglycosylase TgtA [Candidatus Bathyarchaeota archaeon]